MLGIYYKTLSRNCSTGETVFLITPKEVCSYAENGLLKCKGIIGIYSKDIPIEINGSYDEKQQVYIVTSDSVPTYTEENTFAILEYITSDLTENQKEEIAKISENNLFAFIDKSNAMDELVKIFCKNPKSKRIAKQIIIKVRKLKEQEEITKELMSYGMPLDSIEMLYRKEFTLENLDRNPYIIMLKFNIPIDCIELYAAKRLKIKEYSVMRLCGFLFDSMLYISQCGHTCCTLQGLVRTMNMRFKYHGPYGTQVDAALVNFCISELTNEVAYREVDGKPYVYLHHIWEEETSAIIHMNRLSSGIRHFDYSMTIDDVEKNTGFVYNHNQRECFHALDTSGIKVLTGPPGSGKTAVINGLIDYFKNGRNGKVQLSATTGMAAKVMSKACNDDAVTVNLMLNVRPFDNEVQSRDLNNPVDAELIIVDEVSMLGLQMFSILVKAIRNGSILLLVGDEDQLQSVEYGNVLHDLIHSGNVEVYRLTEILRQSGTICENAQKINHGDHNLITDSSFTVFCTQNPEKIEYALKRYFVKDQSQILSPVKKGELSTSSLNLLFQDRTGTFAASYGKKVFYIGDKVIMTKTNYDNNYVNGDTGHIIGKNDDDSVVVKFSWGNVTIERKDMRDMELADAITVHKSQGSESDDIHVVLPEAAKHMMTRRILYTAVTRAKKTVKIYTVGNALTDAINDTFEKKRITMLGIRISLEQNGNTGS